VGRILWAAALSVVLGWATLTAGAFAGTVPDPRIRGGLSPDGPYQRGIVPVTVAAKQNLFVKVISVDDEPRRVRLYENRLGSGTPDYDIDWFKGSANISDSMATGHRFRLEPDSPRKFRVRIKPRVVSPGPLCLFPTIDAGDGPNLDVIVYFAINGADVCDGVAPR
jgi:hypothetical protein